MSETAYCKPLNAGLASETGAVARKLGRLLDALDVVNSFIVRGDILDDLYALRQKIHDGLEGQGWTVSAMNGQLQGSDKMHVYPQGSKAGAKIRKWRDSPVES